jgi:tetratricopeptide (TPR) repeat protein
VQSLVVSSRVSRATAQPWACLAALALLGCAEWRMRPLTAPYQASAPLVQEQALLGLDGEGNAAALQLIEAEGMPPALTLLRLDGLGRPSRLLSTADAEVASEVAASVRAEGRAGRPLLFEAAGRPWAAAFAKARALGFAQVAPCAPETGERSCAVSGSAPTRARLLLRTALVDSDPPAFVVFVEDGSHDALGEIEIARQPVAGEPFEAGLWLRGPVAWLLAGSVGKGDPLRRTVALRRGSIVRGEAQLDLAHGQADRRAGNLEAARRHLGLAVAADPRFVDALYAAAAAEAVSGHSEEAISLLRRGAEVDARRVQVLGRDDQDLVSLRGREDVRKLLGLHGPPGD